MSKLTILRGISGSGKSTWARQQNAVVISRDNIRHGLLGITPEDWYGGGTLTVDENVVTKIQDAAIAACLKEGKDVIVDNTNIEWKFVKALAKIGYRYGAEVEVKVFDVPRSEAVSRNAMRAQMGGRYVDPSVIEKQYERLSKNKSMTLDPVQPVKPYNGTPGKPKAFLVDIDGTLAHMRDYRGPFDWKRVGLDDVDEVISDIVSSLFWSEDGPKAWKVVVMSGRDGSCRQETIDWLNKHNIPFDELFMRPEKDMRADSIVKAELFDEHVRDNFDVQFVLDDRQQVVDMWRAMGLTCLQVAPGDF